MSNFQALKMIDKFSNYKIKKETFFDLPMKLLVIGKSEMSGKGNILGNLLLRPYGKDDPATECYMNDFAGHNIYIVCPSANLDQKWESIISLKEIPPGNIYLNYSETDLEALYERLQEQFMDDVADGIVPPHKLIIMDDISFKGDLKGKQHGIINRLASNGRHLLISTVILAQKYSDVATSFRENATGFIIFNSTNKQFELIYEDCGSCSKTKFMSLARKATEQPHSFLVINYSNPPEKRFLNQNFAPIDGFLEK